MKITIHRGTHQIGGISTEISTENSRIIIDMGEELSKDPNFVSEPLKIDGVTNENGQCNGVLFTHYHGDHTGQLININDSVPLYIGAFAKKVMLETAKKNKALAQKINKMHTFNGGEKLNFGDITVTAYMVDHSACDSYMFLIEAENRRVLYTGDFRLHGFRGKAIPKILKKIGQVDTLIIEGTVLSRNNSEPVTENQLQKQAKEYMKKYKYVHVLCASANLERICAFSKAVPRGKYFVCDEYQGKLLDLIEEEWHSYSPLYRNIKKTIYGDNILENLRQKGFLMVVRDNQRFREIIRKFDKSESIILYSIWDGYRTSRNSTIPEFLDIVGNWQPLHTSGHASRKDICKFINMVNPKVVIPIHTDAPSELKSLCPSSYIEVLKDGQTLMI